MSYLSDRSIILENWKFFLPIFVLVLSYIYLKGNQKNRSNKNAENSDVTSSEKIKSLAESEYIGEYQEENYVNDEDYAPFLEDDEHVPFPGARVTLEGGAEKFYEIANDRRSVRKYSTKPVDWKIIEKCIHAAGESEI